MGSRTRRRTAVHVVEIDLETSMTMVVQPVRPVQDVMFEAL